MTRIRKRLTAAALLAATLFAALVSAALAAPAAADTVVGTPFAAASADACGYTRGILDWHRETPTRVDVTGLLIDHPTGPDPSAPCAGDPLFSVATFVAYAGDVAVRRVAVRMDNGTREFAFPLVNQLSTGPVDLVTVQVCRQLSTSGPPVRCGAVSRYRSPL